MNADHGQERGINLTQLLKMVGWVGTGGEAKAAIADGLVCVNGTLEQRKRRQLAIGDRVEIKGGSCLIITGLDPLATQTVD